MTNEKRLLAAAGLNEIDRIVASMTPDATVLVAAVDDARAALTRAMRSAVPADSSPG